MRVCIFIIIASSEGEVTKKLQSQSLKEREKNGPNDCVLLPKMKKARCREKKLRCSESVKGTMTIVNFSSDDSNAKKKCESLKARVTIFNYLRQNCLLNGGHSTSGITASGVHGRRMEGAAILPT